jgi:hypothetical protein
MTICCNDSCKSKDNLCDERERGALIKFEVNKERVTFWITNLDFIRKAEEYQESGKARVPMFHKLMDGIDCDSQWTWYVDPEHVEWVEQAVELCDGRPSDIENNKKYWFNTVKMYCPWGTTVRSVERR